MNNEVHISSLVVHAHPARIAAVVEALARFADLELHAVDPGGKMVITLETNTQATILERLEQITRLPGVLAANLVYHHSEDAASLAEEIPHENHSP